MAVRACALRSLRVRFDWEEPTERIHRAVNVGKQPYEQVTVFLLDRPDAVAQSTENAGVCLKSEQLLGVSASNLHPVGVADSSVLKPVFGLDHVLVRIID
jgi:hypothetical protein